MTEKTENAATPTEEELVATCESIVRDYLAHRGYEVRVCDGWSCDCEDAPIVGVDGEETVLIAVISAYEEGSARVPALPRRPQRRGCDTPRRGLHRRDGRAPGEASPPHRYLAVGGKGGVT